MLARDLLRALALPLLFAGIAAFAQDQETQAPPPPDPEEASVLVVVAHPDDEFMMSGTIALLAARQNPVTVVYATSGDAGLDVSGRDLKGEELAKTREEEVAAALKILGVEAPPVFLRMKDGHLPESKDELLEKIVAVMDQVSPEVVITFGERGVTGHADHVAVHNAVAAAFEKQKAKDSMTLLNFVVSGKRSSALKKCSTVSYVQNFFPGVADSSVNLVVDVTRYRQQRIDAFFIHYTQFNQNYRTAWVKFTANCPYEEFVVSKRNKTTKSITALRDILKAYAN